MKTIPIIQTDFVDVETRVSSVAICRRLNRPHAIKPAGSLEAIAWVNFSGARVTEFVAVETMIPRRAAIIRLARRMLARSIPARFV